MELIELEKKVHALIALCRQLHSDNSALLNQLDALRHEKSLLRSQLDEAEQRVSEILERIKIMEQGLPHE